VETEAVEKAAVAGEKMVGPEVAGKCNGTTN